MSLPLLWASCPHCSALAVRLSGQPHLAQPPARPPTHCCRAFQLEAVALPVASLQPALSSGLQPAAAQLQVGARVLVKPPGSTLWQAAELTEVDAQGQRVAAVTLADRRRHVLPLSAVALSAHAPNPHASGDSSGDEGGGRAGGRSRPGISEPGGSDDGDEEEGSSGSGSGSGWEEGEDGDRAASPGGGFGRLSEAMAEAAGLLQQQAANGAQTSTLLFFSSESHSRGIGSKARCQHFMNPFCIALPGCCASAASSKGWHELSRGFGNQI